MLVTYRRTATPLPSASRKTPQFLRQLSDPRSSDDDRHPFVTLTAPQPTMVVTSVTWSFI
jgi:hypothetical protein